ncbi:MAG: glycosyltransferase family 2 protein [Thermoplasmata archaeon]|nr:glycosyltransferase family 2 protein [Thermoplasmata archaeon]
MFISVVVAVRNEARHIRKCMESLVNQDYENYEIIVVDGMSDDGTYEILKEMQEKYEFKLFRNEKRNAAAGRNIGIEKAKGDVIAFIDGDAVASRDWLSSIEKAMRNNEVAGVGGPDMLPENAPFIARAIGYVMTSPIARGGRLNPSTQHTMMEKERYVGHIPTCNLAIRKEIFYEVGLFDESFVKGQDLELNYRITKAGHKLLYSPSIRVVHHRKENVKDFARQIYKWAKAKVAIIRKHGMDGIISHVYLWPAYALLGVVTLLLLSMLFNMMHLFLLLLFLGGVTYFMAILVESARLTARFNERKLFLYSLLLLPLVHIAYTYGVMVALTRRKIW